MQYTMKYFVSLQFILWSCHHQVVTYWIFSGGKVCPYPRHEGIKGNRSVMPLVLNMSAILGWDVGRYSWLLCTKERILIPVKYGAGWAQNWSILFGKKISFLPQLGFKPWIVYLQHSHYSDYTISAYFLLICNKTIYFLCLSLEHPGI